MTKQANVSRRTVVNGAFALLASVAAGGEALGAVKHEPPITYPIADPDMRLFFEKLADAIRMCPDGFRTVISLDQDPRKCSIWHGESETVRNMLARGPRAHPNKFVFDLADADRIDTKILGLSSPRGAVLRWVVTS